MPDKKRRSNTDRHPTLYTPDSPTFILIMAALALVLSFIFIHVKKHISQ